jgi:hypothetical protein
VTFYQFVPDRTFLYTEAIGSVWVPYLEPTEGHFEVNRSPGPRLTSHAWSPLGVSTDGSPVLVICACSNTTVDFRVLGCRSGYPFVELFESSNLCDILREQWLRLMLYSPRKLPMTEMYPSFSSCNEPPQQRGIASFYPKSVVRGSSLLATGWGELIFIWHLSSGKNPYVLGAVSPTCSHSVHNPIVSIGWSSMALDSIGDSSDVVGFSVILSDGKSQAFEISIKELNQNIEIEHIHASPISADPVSYTFSRKMEQKDTLQWRSGAGLCLAACSSPNAALDFALKRTSGSVHITRFLSVTTIADAVRMIISVVSLDDDKPVMDLAIALGNLYSLQPESKLVDKRLLPLDQDDLLGSVIFRLTHMDIDYSQVPETVRKRLAFGLHHLHSRVDPMAAANSRARFSERKMILSCISGGPRLESSIAPCAQCDSMTKVMDDHQFVVCENHHRFEICQDSREALRREAIRCNFCWLAVNESSELAVRVCQICRLGVTSSIVR